MASLLRHTVDDPHGEMCFPTLPAGAHGAGAAAQQLMTDDNPPKSHAQKKYEKSTIRHERVRGGGSGMRQTLPRITRESGRFHPTIRTCRDVGEVRAAHMHWGNRILQLASRLGVLG